MHGQLQVVGYTQSVGDELNHYDILLDFFWFPAGGNPWPLVLSDNPVKLTQTTVRKEEIM